MFRVLLALAVVTACVYGQGAPKCVGPREWTSYVLENDPSRQLQIFGKLYYDSTKQSTLLVGEADGIEIAVYRIFPDKKEYIINQIEETCESYELTRQWRPFEVDPSAFYGGTYYLGSADVEGDGVRVSHWYTRFGGDTLFQSIVNTTVVNCIPVQDYFYSQATGFVSTNFFDVTVQEIPDNIFAVPPICKK